MIITVAFPAWDDGAACSPGRSFGGVCGGSNSRRSAICIAANSHSVGVKTGGSAQWRCQIRGSHPAADGDKFVVGGGGVCANTRGYAASVLQLLMMLLL